QRQGPHRARQGETERAQLRDVRDRVEWPSQYGAVPGALGREIPGGSLQGRNAGVDRREPDTWAATGIPRHCGVYGRDYGMGNGWGNRLGGRWRGLRLGGTLPARKFGGRVLRLPCGMVLPKPEWIDPHRPITKAA